MDGRNLGTAALALGIAAAALAAAGCGDGAPPGGGAPAAAPAAGEPGTGGTPEGPPAPDPALLARGEELYRRECLGCHGAEGRGDGPLAVHLLPRPRDFTAARYRITSTLQNQPTDGDLLRTLRRGFPGTAMPSFAHLPEKDLEALVARVKAIAARPIDPSFDPERPDATGPIPVPPEPEDDEAGRARGAELYAAGCAPCHGPEGRGDGQVTQVDDRGVTTWPRDLSSGEWKGGSSGEEIYRRIVAGMAGSPMPASQLRGDDAWRVVQWVRARADLDPEGRNEQRRIRLAAARAPGGAPLDPADPAWDGTAEVRVALMPLWMRRGPRVQSLRAAALHDGERLAIRLRWEDGTRDESTFGQREFRDGAAVQLSNDASPPFFAMGGTGLPGEGSPVSIGMWKADRQADAAAGGKRDLESRFPAMAGDGYPQAISKEGLVVPGLPLERHAPLFLSGKAAGNPVSDLSGARTAESLSARGAGTLGFRAGGAAMEGRGEWRDGTWTVVLRRALGDEGEAAVPLAPGSRASVAFAVWDGAVGDRNGIKSVTIWHDLELEE